MIRLIDREKLKSSSKSNVSACLTSCVVGFLIVWIFSTLYANVYFFSSTMLGFVFSTDYIAPLYICLFILIPLFLGSVVFLGETKMYINISRGFDVRATDVFSHKKYYAKAFLLKLVIGAFTILFGILLIIPGFIAYYKMSMAKYILSENPTLSIWQAIKQSANITQGNKSELFVLDLSYIGWFIFSALLFFVPLIWIVPYYNTVKASYFNELIDYSENTPSSAPIINNDTNL